jgi:hypothetical protein
LPEGEAAGGAWEDVLVREFVGGVVNREGRHVRARRRCEVCMALLEVGFGCRAGGGVACRVLELRRMVWLDVWASHVFVRFVRARFRSRVVAMLVGRGVTFVPGPVFVVPLSHSSCLRRVHIVLRAWGERFCTYHLRVRILKPWLRCWRAVP